MGSSPFMSLMPWHGQRSSEERKSGGNGAAKNTRAKSTGDIKSAKMERAKSTGDTKSAVANNKAPTPNGVHYMLFQQRTKGAESFAVATARLQQGLSQVQGWVSCQSESLAHPLDPLRRRSALVSKEKKKRQAKEMRDQKEAMAHGNAEEKVVRYLEKMIAKDYKDHERKVGKDTKERRAVAEEKAKYLEKQLSVK